MTDLTILRNAITLVQQATEEDRNKNYPEALRLYKLSFDFFVVAFRCEKSEKSKQLIKEKIIEYLHRAEKIKEFIETEHDLRYNLKQYYVWF
jgi:vacuolar protein-sorting-associated protein 4